jgi:ABC-2 type transport system ATP-binding protein
MVTINNLHYAYGRHGRELYGGLDMTIGENKIYGLLGKNGSGKSTLLYLLSGLLFPRKGDITVLDYNTRQRAAAMLREVFIVPEEYDMPDIPLQQFIDINSTFYPHFSEEVLRQCLRDFEMDEKPNLHELSMGQKKKVYMSFALAAGTRLLLMDEPTNGLDIPSKSLFRKVVASNMSDDRTLIISTHQVHDVESLLDHLLLIDNGRLLLNASVSDLTDRYAFRYLQPSEMSDDVLYAEPSLQGNASIIRRKDGEPETPINLELLFNAVTKGKIQ